MDDLEQYSQRSHVVFKGTNKPGNEANLGTNSANVINTIVTETGVQIFVQSQKRNDQEVYPYKLF